MGRLFIFTVLLAGCVQRSPDQQRVWREPVPTIVGTEDSSREVERLPSTSSDHDRHREPIEVGRERFIKKGIRLGLWEKTELTGTLPKLWITRTFLLLGEKEQNQMLSAVYAYWMDRLAGFGKKRGIKLRESLILMYDNATPAGRRVGQYNPIDGVEFYR